MGERSEYMNSEELKSIIESAREAKGISQRELAKLSGISRSTLNDIINGKIKKRCRCIKKDSWDIRLIFKKNY